MNHLTDRQNQVLACIRQHMDSTGMPPTRSELAKILGFKSINAAEQHLKALAKKGVIELMPGASRGIKLLTPEDLGLPVIGRVAAGEPILATQHVEDHYKLLPDMFRPRANYLLRVEGESMRDIGIVNGDLLAVHEQPTAENGQVIVARVDEDVTVKRLKCVSKYIVHLLPENADPAYQPIIVDLRERHLTIEGLGVGVIRNRL
jgi:repressor LexA